ncbi:hypothetical protein RHGRI_021305 [Rhododendron griersonianum]|uniref:Lipoxygenase domain-containing protein n=1 Tax=Rhododendron griersonianum TaxID=479676 RepID=A0AAV6JK17_9ERIC|nr:hypothetical protein RHGRI_021305 [Rhododendron griersonianum]
MTDVEPLEGFDRFGNELGEIKDEINEMNSDGKFRNRVGPVKMPYTLLCPTIQDGLTALGNKFSTNRADLRNMPLRF